MLGSGEGNYIVYQLFLLPTGEAELQQSWSMETCSLDS